PADARREAVPHRAAAVLHRRALKSPRTARGDRARGAGEHAGGQAQRPSWKHVECRGGARMLAIIGVILIVLWLIGLAFKVTVWAIHLALIAGLVLIVLNFLVGRRPTAVP